MEVWLQPQMEQTSVALLGGPQRNSVRSGYPLMHSTRLLTINRLSGWFWEYQAPGAGCKAASAPGAAAAAVIPCCRRVSHDRWALRCTLCAVRCALSCQVVPTCAASGVKPTRSCAPAGSPWAPFCLSPGTTPTFTPATRCRPARILFLSVQAASLPATDRLIEVTLLCPGNAPHSC